jgi:hypothetical protein
VNAEELRDPPSQDRTARHASSNAHSSTRTKTPIGPQQWQQSRMTIRSLIVVRRYRKKSVGYRCTYFTPNRPMQLNSKHHSAKLGTELRTTLIAIIHAKFLMRYLTRFPAIPMWL